MDNKTYDLSGLAGTGVWQSQTLQAVFLRAEHSYTPDLDPRLPRHVSLVTTDPANSAITVSNITLVGNPTIGANLGYLRIGADVWSYTVSNSHGVYGLANVTATTSNLAYAAGTVVSILGIR